MTAGSMALAALAAFAAQGLKIKSDEVVFKAAYAMAQYCVIDLSGGANASS